MFEVPDAKRVRREDLDLSSEDESVTHNDAQDAELLAKLHARMAGMLDLSGAEQTAPATESAAPTTTEAVDEAAAAGETGAAEPEEFEFRLFTAAPATKIALVDEDDGPAGEGAMLRKKPLAYFIAEMTPEARAEFAEAAVSGDEVLARAAQRWWGMEMPWRVTRVVGEEKKKRKDDEEATARRRRPGKKKRIALRLKEREKKKKAEEQKNAKADKEEHLKEKKKRLNRLKKLRRRAKDKEAKQGGAEGGGDDSAKDSDGDE